MATTASVSLAPTGEEGRGEGARPTEDEWTPDRLAAAMDAFLAEHEYLCLDPNARNLRHTYVTVSDDKKLWRVQQMLVDPEAANDWVAEFEVNLAGSRAAGEPVMRLKRIGALAN
jgi:hypothetical protein